MGEGKGGNEEVERREELGRNRRNGGRGMGGTK